MNSNTLKRARTCDVSYLYRMPAGIPGEVTRAEHATVEPDVIDSSNPPTAYGVPVAMDATAQQIRPIGAGDTASSLYGLLVRPYPTNSSTDPLNTSTPPTSGACSVLRRGYMTVQLNGGAAVKRGGQVYVRVANAAAGKPLGGIEGASDTTNTVAAPATFMGAADADGMVEIAWNI